MRRTVVLSILAVACGPRDAATSISGSYGSAPVRSFDVTYTVAGFGTYTKTYDSKVAVDDGPVGPVLARTGRGYVIETQDPRCPNDLVFNGTPEEMHAQYRGDSFRGVIPLSTRPMLLDTDLAFQAFDENGDRHYLLGGTFIMTDWGPDFWEVEVHDVERCSSAGGVYGCEWGDGLVLTMRIEGDLLVDPSDRLVAQSSYVVDATTDEPACTVNDPR